MLDNWEMQRDSAHDVRNGRELSVWAKYFATTAEYGAKAGHFRQKTNKPARSDLATVNYRPHVCYDLKLT